MLLGRKLKIVNVYKVSDTILCNILQASLFHKILALLNIFYIFRKLNWFRIMDPDKLKVKWLEKTTDLSSHNYFRFSSMSFSWRWHRIWNGNFAYFEDKGRIP